MKIIISIIIGFIISYIVSHLLFTPVIRGPDSNIVRQQIFIDDHNHCYRFKPDIRICPL